MTVIRVLFTGSGRRVSLLRFFRRSGERLGFKVELHAADAAVTAPTWEVADEVHQVPRADDRAFLPAVAEICRDCGIDLVVPLIDPELPVLASGRQEIEETGADLMLSERATVEIASDKLRTWEHFQRNGIRAPRTLDLQSDQMPLDVAFPLVLKPR